MPLPKFLENFIAKTAGDTETKLKETRAAKEARLAEEKREREAKKQRLAAEATEAEIRLRAEEKRLQELRSELETISTSLLTHIKNLLKIRKLQSEMAIGKKTYEELRQHVTGIKTAIEKVDQEATKSTTPSELEEAEEALQDFYQEQVERWSQSEYSLEEIQELFTEEHLSSLSIDDYILLMRRFPSEMVTHVTRQGVRDHTGHMFHTRGEGGFADGFEQIVADGRLRSPLGIQLVQKEKEAAIARYLGDDREMAKAHLQRLFNISAHEPGSYQDAMAIHFATEEVADCYYGSEMGNEIFFVYPSAFIASQYHFSGTLTDAGGGYWNDQWVWANEERGIPLNAGLVFIPAEARVDRQTGSRYELDSDKRPIINQVYIDQITKLLESPKIEEIVAKVEEVNEKLRYKHFYSDSEERAIRSEHLAELHTLLETEFGITDKRVREAFLDYELKGILEATRQAATMTAPDPFFITPEQRIKKKLQERGILYKEATDTVSSREFWTEYFKKHPDKKPNKIVFYNAANPTAALRQWKRDNDLDKKGPKQNLGFTDRVIDRKHKIALAGFDRVAPLLQEVYDKHFGPDEDQPNEPDS